MRPVSRTRTVNEVFEHHLQMANEGRLEEMPSDYAADAVFITKDDGVLRGPEAIKGWFAGLLNGVLVGAQFTATTLTGEGEALYMEWVAEGRTHRASGVDTFVIRGGAIRAQTVKVLTLSAK